MPVMGPVAKAKFTLIPKYPMPSPRRLAGSASMATVLLAVVEIPKNSPCAKRTTARMGKSPTVL